MKFAEFYTHTQTQTPIHREENPIPFDFRLINDSLYWARGKK